MRESMRECARRGWLGKITLDYAILRLIKPEWAIVGMRVPEWPEVTLVGLSTPHGASVGLSGRGVKGPLWTSVRLVCF